jgi:hypothetical protein
MESIKKFEGPRGTLNHEIKAPEIGDELLRQIRRALAATATGLAEARDAFEVLCRKTKVYALMKRGLLPYVVETKTGHRRVEYRALQHFVKRLRSGRLERKAS